MELIFGWILIVVVVEEASFDCGFGGCQLVIFVVVIFGWILIVVVVEEASFDCGFGGCQLVIFVVVGEEREREREEYFLLFY